MLGFGRVRILLACGCIILATCLTAQAEQIGLSKAEKVAFNWMSSVSGPYGPLTAIQNTLTEETEGIPVFHIVNFQPIGFVIVAADDAFHPILGYSFESQFALDDPPRAFDIWMGHLKKEIFSGIERNSSRPFKRSELWRQLDVDPSGFENPVYLRTKTGRLTAKGTPPLLTTNWGQGRYYNDQYPADPSGPGGHFKVASAATAMGQILKYWGQPTTGSGADFYAHSVYGFVSADYGNTTYDWARMPGFISSANFEIARLLYHCGVSLKASLADPYREKFGYSRSVTYEYKDNFPSDESWFKVLRNELDNGRPVHYRLGKDGENFVIDGYQQMDFFHVNWGSNGALNGYFYFRGIGRRLAAEINQSAAYRIIPSNLMPEPELSDVVVPNSISLGSSIDLYIEACNIGQSATEGCISVSFPGLTSPDDAQYVEGFVPSAEIGYREYTVGSAPVPHQRGHEIVPDYLIVEMATSSWANLEKKSLLVRVTPQKAGPFEILVRSTMGIKSALVNSPVDSFCKDQQGWDVKRYVVDVLPSSASSNETELSSAQDSQALADIPYTIPLYESFDAPGPSLPPYWTTQNEGEGIVDMWGISGSNDAGGAPYEAICGYQSVDPGTTRLILPVLNTVGRSVLALSFKHKYYAVATGIQLKVQTSTDGIGWTDESWSVEANSEIGPVSVTAYITHNLNSASTFVAFVMTGNLYNTNGWYIDDVSVTAPSTSFPFSESFDAPGPSLPPYWTTQNEGEGIVDMWGISGSNDAGGAPYEAICGYQSVDPGTTRLILPVLNTVGRSVLALSFKHKYYAVATGIQLKVQTSTNGIGWTDESWSVEANSEIGPVSVTAYITHNLNSASTFVAFVMTGNLYNTNGWYIDDVSVTAPSTSFPFSESFDAPGPSLPPYWTTQNEGEGIVDMWGISGSNDAGGAPYEAICGYQSVDPGTTRLILPVLNTVGRSVLALSFKHKYYAVATGIQLKVQTSTDGIGWTDESWSVEANSEIGPVSVTAYITHNLNSASTFVAFVMTGNLYNTNGWYIDDVYIEAGGSSARKVDFNNDGQEDILWRYQGEGTYQGLVLAWLMDQSGSPTPAYLEADGIALDETGALVGRRIGTLDQEAKGSEVRQKALAKSSSPSIVMGEMPAAMKLPRIPRDSIKTIMEGKGTPVAEPQLSMRDATDGSRIMAAGRGRVEGLEFRDIPTMTDAADITSVGDGTIEIAAISRGSEVGVGRVTDTAWEIAGTGDFNSDGKVDILWRYYGPGTYQGLNVIWHMDGTTRLNEVVFSRVTDTAWRIAGTGDFNSDGKVDILWRYYGPGTYQGLDVIWHMDGTTRLNEVVFSRVTDTAWRIAGTGDFNADGKTDILWRYHGTGTYQGLNLVWHMDGAIRTNEVIFSRVTDTAWEIGGTGDFDSDGKVDILWRYYGPGTYQGLNVIWYMDGTTRLSEEIFSRVSDTNWRIVNR